ncbi:hypothetical protein HDU93_006804, partial [Gonapodya sp. JEL0774]
MQVASAEWISKPLSQSDEKRPSAVGGTDGGQKPEVISTYLNITMPIPKSNSGSSISSMGRSPSPSPGAGDSDGSMSGSGGAKAFRRKVPQPVAK